LSAEASAKAEAHQHFSILLFPFPSPHHTTPVRQIKKPQPPNTSASQTFKNYRFSIRQPYAIAGILHPVSPNLLFHTLSQSLSQLKTPAGRRQLGHRCLALGGRLARRTGAFLRTCYVDGGRALLTGSYSHRQAAVIIAASTPAILGVLFLTVPALLFPTPGHNAFYHFAHELNADPASMMPVLLGAVSSTLGLKVAIG